jgi:hypothetical protein
MRPAPAIDRSRLPHFWRDMGFTAKAAWLCSARLARDYSEACTILAGMRKRAPRATAAAPVAAAEAASDATKQYWWSK